MEVVGNRFSWQHQRLFYPRGVPGLWDPAHRCGCPKFACTQGKQDELMEKSFSGDYEMLSHLQSLLVTRHHLKNLSGLMLRSAALNVEKKREKNRLFCFVFPRRNDSSSEIWKQKLTVKRQMLFDPLHLSLVLHPSNLLSFLICTRCKHSWGISYLSKSHVCGHCGPWIGFSTVAQCNGIKSIWFFNKGGIPLAKTTLNMTLNQPGSYQNVPIIFSSPTQLSTQHYLSLRN